jgi:micrococcal nuclease
MYEYKAKVVRVIDGDTIKVEIDCGFGITFKETLRLLDIDTPELRAKTKEEREHAKDAKAFLAGYTFGQDIVIRTKKDKKGKYGRYLAHIFMNNGLDLIALLKERGFEKRKDYK